MEAALSNRVRIGDFEFDAKAGELRGGDRKVRRLQEQPFQILLMLVERVDGLVTREEIKNKLWPNDTVVEFDHSIHTAINKLRQAFGDSAEDPKYIETVARRGYRLMVPVEGMNATPSVLPAGVDALPMPVATAASLIGKKISHYRVLELLGGGGMGLVFQAEDLKLGRAVALKFLPEEVASDATALERFEREARAASSLDHPNICSIYEFGEHEGRPFIAMQLLEGQTLRDRLARGEGSLSLQDLLDIGIQVTDALQAACEKGIIHRDIKPANIFLTNKGACKILDFGLAKLLECAEEDEVAAQREGISFGPSSTSGVTHLTRTGIAMGTAGYMSPEQVRGEKLDARTDIFSFGLVLYEMATGQRAFSGETAAVVQNAILNSAPTPVRDLNSTLPPKFVAIVDKALEKDRDHRYQSAADMRADLQKLKEVKPQRVAPQRWRWYAAATLLIALVVAGSLYWRARRKVKLTQKDTIVLAHVVNNTGDTVIDDALDYPLLRKVAESPYVTVLYPSKVFDTLRLMKVANISYIYTPQTPKLTPELAREVCVRSGSRAFVTAYIANTGNAYDIALNAQDCHSGRVLAKVERQTSDRNQIVKTLGVAGYELRRELGEPEDSLTRFNTPLENDTSWSLEALQALSQAQQIRAEQNDAAAIPQYKRAAELDPNLAVAYLNIAAIYYGTDEASSMMPYATKAFALRGRLSQRSRWFVEALYYTTTGELEKANATLIQLEQTFPADVYAHQNRVSCLVSLGQLEQATVEARDSVRLLPNTTTYGAIMEPLLLTNRLQEAKVVFEEAEGRGIDSLWLRKDRYTLAFLQGDNAAMQEQLSRMMATPEGKAWALQQPGLIAFYHGRFRAGRESFSAMHGFSPKSAADIEKWDIVADTALADAETGHPVQARQAAERALAAAPPSTFKRTLTLVFARAGAVNEAEKLAEVISQESPLDTLVQKYELPTIRAAIELHKGQPARAIEILQPALPYDFSSPVGSPAEFLGWLYPAYLRGLAYLQLGQGREAAAEFQKMVDHPGILQDKFTAPLSHLQLGRAQAMMGDKAAARKSYQDFLTIWKDADPDIPIYQQAKAEYARLL